MITKKDGEIPEHPELYYRITGEWKGWHDFLGPQSENSDEVDKSEDLAFSMLKKRSDYQCLYDVATIKIWNDLQR